MEKTGEGALDAHWRVRCELEVAPTLVRGQGA
jgi:hypothetical protein